MHVPCKLIDQQEAYQEVLEGGIEVPKVPIVQATEAMCERGGERVVYG